MTNDETVSRLTARYPIPDLSPAEFEVFATTLFESASVRLPGLIVQLHETIEGTDGTFEFDVTVRYRVGGLEFLVLVEAKRQAYPIKRSLVQELHSKQLSVGAHKSVMISTAPYQAGALKFALTHRIALVTVSEGRFTFEARSSEPIPAPAREQAAALGMPELVGHCYSPAPHGGIAITLMSSEHPEYVADRLLGIAQA